MGKLPFIQFYPGDWVQDTAALSLAAKGAWIDILCALWRSPTRGALTLNMVAWARIMRASVDQAKAVIDELVSTGTCDYVTLANSNVTLSNRRMIREEKERESTRLRVRDFRKRKSNGNETPYISEVIFQKSETPLTLGATTLRAKEEKGHTIGLVEDIVRYCRDPNSRAFFRRAAEKNEGLLREAFGELKMREREGADIGNRGAYLVTLVKRWSDE